jgi:RND family efflux transporter MFP subunit
MSTQSIVRRAVKSVLPVAVVAGGVLVLLGLKATRPEAKRTPQSDRDPTVEVFVARAADHDVEVLAQGRVIPARQVSLQPEVGGRIVWQHAALVPGGRFKKGELLLRIDGRDYELALQQQQAAVDRARLDLEIERSRKKVAEREWQLLGDKRPQVAPGPDGGPPDLLALREPQLRTARVGLEAAQSGLERAKLDINRTVLRAPFNAVVQLENAEIGQLVGPQSPLVTLVGTDHFWVQVSIPVDNLARIKIPGINAEPGAGSVARVWQDVGGARIERAGRIARLLGDLDPTGGMARVLVEIDDPLALTTAERAAEPGLPLLVGAFVNVRIDAGQVAAAIEVPRQALRDGTSVSVVNTDSRLEMREVQIVWRFPDRVLVRNGVVDGDQVVTSRLGEIIAGTKVQIAEQPPAAEAEAARPTASTPPRKAANP